MAFARPTILGLLMVIFLRIPARTPPELRLRLGSSLSSLNISISHSKFITVEYTHMKLLLSSDGQIALSRPSLVSTTLTRAPGCMTSLRAEVQSTLVIIIDLGVNSLVSALNGGEVAIYVAARAERRLRLGPWWVAVFDLDVSGLTFTAPTNGEGSGSGYWMILRGTLSCSLDIIPQLW
ncbi:hypothetical protein ACJRO7_009654 [Eucalyptus globulus]|uniref:Uncharacterized protein n=1 Tax=Eucalyptus globulus TaxID=34317 RepID=A0ABD3LCZ6_EUCGL